MDILSPFPWGPLKSWFLSWGLLFLRRLNECLMLLAVSHYSSVLSPSTISNILMGLPHQDNIRPRAALPSLEQLTLHDEQLMGGRDTKYRRNQPTPMWVICHSTLFLRHSNHFSPALMHNWRGKTSGSGSSGNQHQADMTCNWCGECVWLSHPLGGGGGLVKVH